MFGVQQRALKQKVLRRQRNWSLCFVSLFRSATTTIASSANQTLFKSYQAVQLLLIVLLIVSVFLSHCQNILHKVNNSHAQKTEKSTWCNNICESVWHLWIQFQKWFKDNNFMNICHLHSFAQFIYLLLLDETKIWETTENFTNPKR